MIFAKVSSKGQVNIPKAVRERLGVEAGERIRFDVTVDSVRLVGVPSLTPAELRGAFHASAPAADLGALRRIRQRELATAYKEGLGTDD